MNKKVSERLFSKIRIGSHTRASKGIIILGVFKKMKKKYYFVILFLVLAIFLSGCSGVTTPSINLTGNFLLQILAEVI
jgi:hypothetical protein